LNTKIINIKESNLIETNTKKREIKHSRKRQLQKDNKELSDKTSMSYIMIDDKQESKNNLKESKLSNVNILNVMPSIYNNKINCNGVELIREKVNQQVTSKDEDKYVYDIYYVKNSEIDLNLFYSNNYEIKSGFIENEELVDEVNDEEECSISLFC